MGRNEGGLRALVSLNVNNNVSGDIYSEKRTAADDIIDCVRPTKNIFAFRRTSVIPRELLFLRRLRNVIPRKEIHTLLMRLTRLKTKREKMFANPAFRNARALQTRPFCARRFYRTDYFRISQFSFIQHAKRRRRIYQARARSLAR